MVQPPRRLRNAISTLIVLCAVAACGKEAPPPPAAAEATYDADGALVGGKRKDVPKPNILLVCLGGVRADAEMKWLASFAAESTSFVDATAPAASTVPSVCSLLTGLLPSNHGVSPNSDQQGERPLLIPAIRTLAEILKAQGYTTTAMTGGGALDASWGLGQGFDTFRSDVHLNTRATPGTEGIRLAAQFEGSSGPHFVFLHVAEDEVFEPVRGSPERVKALLDPLLAIANEEGGELPIGAGADFVLARYAEPDVYLAAVERFGREHVETAIHRYVDVAISGDGSKQRLSSLMLDAYRRRVDYLDYRLRHLVGGDSRVPPPPSSIFLAPNGASPVILFVSDHGVAFGEHDDLGHGRWLYDEVIRIPMMISAPGQLPAGVVHGAVSLLDVLPTILDLVGLPPLPDCDGRSLLGPAMRVPHDRWVPAQEHRFSRGPGSPASLALISIRSERAKYIATLDNTTLKASEEIYDLAADPGERKKVLPTDVARFGPDFVAVVEDMRHQIQNGVANAQDLFHHGYAASRGAVPAPRPK